MVTACGSAGNPSSTADTTSTAGSADTKALSSTKTPVAARPPATVRVPTDAPTIQAAVDASVEGDLILIAPGTYNEAVDVFTAGITIRGEDRNTVILDGLDELENGFKVATDRVAIENLTVRRYTFNGVLFTKAYDDNAEDPTKHELVNGYRASHLTVANNGQYGIYAFFARGGLMTDIYASGHPDSGIYVGQCKPCDTVLTKITAERNSIGYQGTNASGNLFITNSVWSNNRIGVTPNSQNMERLAPQGDVVIVGNLIRSNNAADAPATAQGAFGVGIAIAGGNRNIVTRNRIEDNVSAGVIVTDLNGYQPEGNQIVGNELALNGTDLVLEDSTNPASIPRRGNCFAKNRFARSIPDAIESVLPCDSNAGGPVAAAGYRPVAPPPDVDYRTVALPGPQPTMTDPMAAPGPVGAPPRVDVDAIAIHQGTP